MADERGLTVYHAKYFAHELTKRCASDTVEKLASALSNAQVDLNPHQIEAALFAFRSPLSRGAILADEVGLEKQSKPVSCLPKSGLNATPPPGDVRRTCVSNGARNSQTSFSCPPPFFTPENDSCSCRARHERDHAEFPVMPSSQGEWECS